jgi:hypothetical protein
MKEKEFYLNINQIGCIIDAQQIVGKIEFFDTFDGAMVLEAIKRGMNIIIKPSGYVEHDENGDLKKFTLTGFTIENTTC